VCIADQPRQPPDTDADRAQRVLKLSSSIIHNYYDLRVR
jgi:hypothetical protein